MAGTKRTLELGEASGANPLAKRTKRRRQSQDLRKLALQNSAGILSMNGDEAFSPPASQSSLGTEYLESDIEIVQTIGFRPRSVIFKATARGKPCFLEIFKHDTKSIGSGGQPGPNAAFTATVTAQEKLQPFAGEGDDKPVVQYFGTVKFWGLPHDKNSPSSAGRRFSYKDFLYGLDNNDIQRKALWKQYFKNKSKSQPILQGLIMDDMTGFKPLVDSEFWGQGTDWWRTPPSGVGPKAVAEVIYEYIRFIHSRGIFYGSSEDFESIQIKKSEISEMPIIALTDFSISKTANSANKKFHKKFLRELRRKRRDELRWWEGQVKVLSRG